MNQLLLALLLVSGLSSAAIVPESIRTQDKTVICNTKTGTIRNVTDAEKKAVYAKAGVTPGDTKLCPAKPYAFEVDHRISLELGGNNDISNLQLQAYCTLGQLTATDGKPMADSNGKIRSGAVPLYKGLYDAHAKDKAENQTHADICSGKVTPAEAQDKIYNWKN